MADQENSVATPATEQPANTGTVQQAQEPIVTQSNELRQPLINNDISSVVDGIFSNIEKAASSYNDKKVEEVNPVAPEVKPAVQDVKPVVEEVKKEAEVKTAQEATKPDATAEKKATDDSEITDEDLKPSFYDKPKTRKRIEKLLKIAEDAKNDKELTVKQLKELESKIASIEKANPDAVTDETKQRLEELAMFKRRYALDNDNEVAVKFDKAIAADEENIIKTLKSHALPEWIEKTIKDSGGWRNFADSDDKIRFSVTNEYGEKETREASKSEFARSIISKLPLGSEEEVRASVSNQINANRNKTAYIKDEVAKANEYFANQEKAAKEVNEKYAQNVQSISKTFETFYADTTNTVEWLKDKAIPETASAEEKEAIARDNNYTGNMRDLFKNYLAPKSMEAYQKEYPQMAMEAVAFYQAKRDVEARDARIKKLEADIASIRGENEKIKGATKTVKGALLSTSAKTSQQQVSKNTSIDDIIANMYRTANEKANR